MVSQHTQTAMEAKSSDLVQPTLLKPSLLKRDEKGIGSGLRSVHPSDKVNQEYALDQMEDLYSSVKKESEDEQYRNNKFFESPKNSISTQKRVD